MIAALIRKLRLFPDEQPADRLTATLRPDPAYRKNSMAQLPPARREKRERLHAELIGVGNG